MGHWRTQFLMRLSDIANQLNRIADHFEMQDESETALRLREYKKGYEDGQQDVAAETDVLFET